MSHAYRRADGPFCSVPRRTLCVKGSSAVMGPGPLAAASPTNVVALPIATLRLAGLSEIFTQDLEDQKEESHGAHPPSATQNQADPALPVPPAGAGDSPAAGAISPRQKRLLEAKINQLGLDRQRVKAWLEKATRGRIQHFQEMSPAIFDILLTKLDDWAQAPPAATPPDDAPAPPVPPGRPIEGTLIPEGYQCLTTQTWGRG